MVYKLFDKKSAGSGANHVVAEPSAKHVNNTKLAPQNQQLAEELHKPIIKKFEKRRYTQHLKIIFGVLI